VHISRSQIIQTMVVLVVLAILAFIARNIAIGWNPSRDQYPIQGISVSAENGDITWHVAGATGVDFAYILATRSEEFRDPQFAKNIQQSGNAGIRRGAVHEYSLCRLASDQATNFVTTVPRIKNMLPPAVRLSYEEDCEDRPGRALVLTELNTFLNQIESHTGKSAIVAVSKDFENDYNISSGINRTFWLSDNFFPPNYATKPWVMWQASDMKRVSGINGPVRWNVVRP